MSKKGLSYLKLTLQYNEKKNELEDKRSEQEELLKEYEVIETSLRELNEMIEKREEVTEEDKTNTITEAERVEQKLSELDKSIKEIEAEVKEYEEKIKAHEEKVEEAKQEPEKRELNSDFTKREEVSVMDLETRGMYDDLEMRSYLAELTKREEVENFANSIRDVVIGEKRSITGADATIPTEISYLILREAKVISKLYKEVTVKEAKGYEKVFADLDEVNFEWTLTRGNSKEVKVDIKDPKQIGAHSLTGYAALDNFDIDNSDIDLIALVIKLFAKGYAKAIDKAIINGEGAASNQPEGILKATGIKKVEAKNMKEILAAFAEVGDENGDYDGEVVAIVNPKTNKAKIVPQTLNFDSKGRQVANVYNGYLPNGVRIVETSAMPIDKIAIGVPKSYLLRVQKGMKINTSEHAMFIQRKTVVLLDSYADGVLVKPENFVEVTLKAETASTTGK